MVLNRIGGVIVTYNPNIELLKKNISSVYNQLDRIIVVDNGSNNVDVFKPEIIKNDFESKLTLKELKSNLGIAKAQNIGVKELYLDKYEWALILDQDTVMPKDAVTNYSSTSQFLEAKTAILSARYIDKNWNEAQKAELFAGSDSSNRVVPVKMVIASGNLVRISAWKFVGGFDEWLFIDQVDFDFNAKLLLSGYNIWRVNSVIMNHEVGATLVHPVLSKFLLLSNKAVFSDHSAFRQFYILRNRIIFAKRYPMFRRKSHLQIISIIFSVRKIIGYSSPRMAKLRNAIKGIGAGLKYHPDNDLEFQSFLSKVSQRDSKN